MVAGVGNQDEAIQTLAGDLKINIKKPYQVLKLVASGLFVLSLTE